MQDVSTNSDVAACGHQSGHHGEEKGIHHQCIHHHCVATVRSSDAASTTEADSRLLANGALPSS